MFPIFKTKKYKDLDHKFVGTTMDEKLKHNCSFDSDNAAMTYSSSIIMNYYFPFPSFRTIWTFCFENERRGVWDGGAAGSTDKLGIFYQKLFNFHAKVCLKESGGGEDLIHQRMHLSDKPYLPPLPISAAPPPLLIQNSLISSIYALTA